MSFVKKIVSFFKKLDQNIQLSRIAFENKNFRIYILKKYKKKECSTCDGKGFVNEDQSL